MALVYKRNYYYAYFPGILVITMWLIKFIEFYFRKDFKSLGIFPRDINSLSGIFFSPFIHADFKHLIGYTVPIFLLTAAILFFYRKKAYRIIFFLWIFTGTSVWLGGRYSWHIGASGLIYSFSSFLFFSGILSKERKLISISLLIIFLYGGLIWGIIPTNGNISWESHLFGFLVGFILAYFLGKEYIDKELENVSTNNEEFVDINCTHQKEYEIKYWFEDSENNT